MGKGIFSKSLAAGSLALLAGCTSYSTYNSQAMRPATTELYACSGYNCVHRTRIDVGASDADRFAEIMAPAAASASAERAAISNAVQYFDGLNLKATRIKDLPQSAINDSGKKGQMDCLDESANTRTLLTYLDSRGLLKHHSVQRNVNRGFLIDGRYPHSTAVIKEKGGKEWAVDSWYSEQGGQPDIMLLSEWLPRGFMTSGALTEAEKKKAATPAG